jgi:S1-C subfamily serine protease
MARNRGFYFRPLHSAKYPITLGPATSSAVAANDKHLLRRREGVGRSPRTLLVVCALIFSTTLSLARQKEKRLPLPTVSEAIEKVRPAVVQIRIVVRPSPPDIAHPTAVNPGVIPVGTGFLIGVEGYAITARHVMVGVRSLMDRIPGVKEMGVGIALPNIQNVRGVTIQSSFTGVGFEEVDEDAAHDLALLKLKRNPFRGEVSSGIVADGVKVGELHVSESVLDARRPQDGAVVAISGYPLSEPGLVTNAGWMASVWSFTISQTPAQPPAPAGWMIPEVADSYLADVTANPGNSGGPVYLVDSGAVIGVCVGGKLAPAKDQNGQDVVIDGHTISYAAGLTVVVPSQYVVELLKKNGVKWREIGK